MATQTRVVPADEWDKDGKEKAPPAAFTRQGTHRSMGQSSKELFHLKHLNPDADGDGKVSKDEQAIYDELCRADEDKDGALTVTELYGALARLTKVERSRSAYKRAFIAISVFVLFMLASNAILVTCVVWAFKDTHAVDNKLGDDHGHVVQTAPSTTALPLYVAPVLSLDRLSGVTNLLVTAYDDQDDEVSAIGADAALVGADGVRMVVAVSRTSVINATYVIFESPSGDAVHVQNGDAYLRLARGGTLGLCESSVSCASFEIDEDADAEALKKKAADALVAAGFDDPKSQSSRRKLMRRCLKRW